MEYMIIKCFSLNKTYALKKTINLAIDELINALKFNNIFPIFKFRQYPNSPKQVKSDIHFPLNALQYQCGNFYFSSVKCSHPDG